MRPTTHNNLPRHRPLTRPTTPTNPPRHRKMTPPNSAQKPATSPLNNTRDRRHVMTANNNDATQIEHHHHHVTTEWKREEVGMVGKDGRGKRTQGEGEGHDNDDLLVVLPQMFRHQQGVEGRSRAQRHTPSLSPAVLDDDKGAGWHVCASWFLPPPIPAVSSTGASVKPTRRPLRIRSPLFGGKLRL